MQHFAGLIWVAIVLFGVVSSITKNARKAGKAPRKAPAYGRSNVARSAAAVSSPTPVATQRAPAPPPQQVRVIRAYDRAAATGDESAPRQSGMRPPQPQQRSRGALRGMFQDKRSLMRGIVAAEVLGPPAALRESSLWSPRHSEPST